MAVQKTMLFLVISLSLTGCVSTMTSGYIAESDRNGDGSLSFQEYFDSQKPKSGFTDRVKESGMSAEEFAEKEFNEIDVNSDSLVNKKELLKFFNK